MLHQIKAQQFYNDLSLYQQCKILQKIVKFKDFSRHYSAFPVLFKANLIFKDFSRKPCIFKYFSSLSEPWSGCACLSEPSLFSYAISTKFSFVGSFIALTFCMLGNCSALVNIAVFKIIFFIKFFQEHYQSAKRSGSRSGPTFCRS